MSWLSAGGLDLKTLIGALSAYNSRDEKRKLSP